MRVESVYIEKLYKLQKIQIDFPTPTTDYFNNLKISLLVGENGVGKTTLLKFLANAFYYPRALQKDLSSGFHIEYEMQGEHFRLDAKNMSAVDSIKLPSKIIVATYSLYEQIGMKSPDPNHSIEYEYAGPLTKNGNFNQAVACLPILEAFYGKKTKKSAAIRILLKVIGYTEPPAVEVRTLTTLGTTRNQTYDPNVVERLQNYHQSVGTRLRNSSPNTKLIQPNAINRQWLEEIRTVVQAGVPIISTLCFKKGDDWISMSQMSSGETTMFNRFFSLINKMSDNSLLLIDEPEINLHPRWIQQYISLLIELFGDYHAHIILTSHSPLIAADVPKQCIVGLYENEEGFIRPYPVADATLGGNPGEILQTVFKLDDYQGHFTAQTFRRIRECILQGEPQIALAMLQDLGTSTDKFELFQALKPCLSKRM